MLDDISQAQPDQLPIEEVAEVQEETAEGQTPEEQPKEKPVTLADLQELEKRLNSRVQSQVAQGENRINDRIQKRFAALEQNKGALKLTDEQVTDAKRSIIEEEQMREFSPENPQGAGTQTNVPDMNEAERFVMDQVEAVFAEAGIRVTTNDPEYKAIESAWNDPKGSLAKTLIVVNQAAEKKANRIASLKKNAGARVVGGGGSTQNTKPMTAEEKISAGLKGSKWPSEEPKPTK
jgi:hypothetical protein